MVWRVPTREIGAVPYEEGLELPPEYLARDAGNNLPMNSTVPIKHVLFLDFDAIDEISGNLGGLVLPPAEPSSSDYGAYLHKNPAFKKGLHNRRRVKPVSEEVGHTVYINKSSLKL